MVTLKEITELVTGELRGDPGFRVSGINAPHKAGATEIALLAKPGAQAPQTGAAALVVPVSCSFQYANLILVRDPMTAFARLLEFFFPRRPFYDGLHPDARLAEGVSLGRGSSVGPFSYIGPDTVIGPGTEIHANVTVYHDVVIGRDCLIHSGVVIREKVVIGDRVIIQPGAVIGADGFGFTRDGQGRPIKIPQVGRVIIGNDCEIGAGTCIDRSTLEETVLADGVKLDNLVQVGHNVIIGPGTAISAQTGIAGSSRIGSQVIMGGQVGIADHLSIADRVMIAAQCGVTGSVKTEGAVIAGSPHQDLAGWRRSQVMLRNLEGLRERVRRLEEKLKESEK